MNCSGNKPTPLLWPYVAKNLGLLLDDGEAAHTLGKRARGWAEKAFSLKDVGTQLFGFSKQGVVSPASLSVSLHPTLNHVFDRMEFVR
jgi:hypothetical protein